MASLTLFKLCPTQGAAVSRGFGADVLVGENEGGQSACQREELPHLLPGEDLRLTAELFSSGCRLRKVSSVFIDDERSHR